MSIENNPGGSNEDMEKNMVLNIDRTVRPSYPDWAGMASLIRPELENSGPEKIDLSSFQLWRPDSQMDGRQLYKLLKGKDFNFEGCLDLRDLEELSKLDMGLRFKISAFFGHDGIDAWKSAAITTDGHFDKYNQRLIYVPSLDIVSDLAGSPQIGWRSIHVL